MTKYNVIATRYSADGKPVSASHSTVIDTQWKEYVGATSVAEISKIFERTLNVPQENGSRIRVDNIEALVDEQAEKYESYTETSKRKKSRTKM